ncbi:hypothetical protein, conserved [Babesia bigemina]|uniref:Uncharacterized protein n=1 Tax=Babesia bigemina TaxID=5866 RepID=A0A061DC74_BABBI|nr:hypothetical protein, conserved [Babesia bigemina]CDR95375.1 hypothetical protein, conserved [Babesia bigemina]|eukprot:XP_012767561.1 hypothetical protein, conserved [Babesia bigemina]
MLPRKFDIVHPKDLQFLESYDHLVVDNPHVGDPRNLQHTQWNYCRLRYALFCRCCKELGEGNPRCKYQYYRAEMACTQDFLDIANKYRDNGRRGFLSQQNPGTHSTDILPSRQVHNIRQ